MQKMPVATLVSVFDGEVFTVSYKEPFIVGREIDSNAVGMALSEKVVSRKHAFITFEKGKYTLCDNESKNGTFLNGEKILPNQPYSLEHGDVIVFSKSKYIFRIIMQEESAKELCGLEVGFSTAAGGRKLVMVMPGDKAALYQVGMIKSNDIRGILKMTYIDCPEGIKLYYDVDGLDLWQTAVNRGELSEGQNTRIILQIVDIIKSLPRYLLSENNLALRCDLIFIDMKTNMPLLIYLPFAAIEGDGDTAERLAEVIKAVMPEKKEVIDGLKSGDLAISDMHGTLKLPWTETEMNGERDDTQKEQQGDRRFKSREKPGGREKNMSRENVFTGEKGSAGKKGKTDKRIIAAICQIPVLLVTAAVYVLNLLKTADFIGFVLIVFALDAWFIYTAKKMKERAKGGKDGEHPPEKNPLFRKKEKGDAA